MTPEHKNLYARLGTALGEFQNQFSAHIKQDDPPLAQADWDAFLRVVEETAAQGVELSVCWYALGTFGEDQTERLRCYSRALACVRAEAHEKVSSQWAGLHLKADCLYEIARICLQIGQREQGRKYLEEALPVAQLADACLPANTRNPPLEGKVAALLLQLPDDPQA